MRDIKAGEQIYNSYNLCESCGGRTKSYGTPEILRDYGFVEQYANFCSPIYIYIIRLDYINWFTLSVGNL